MLIQQHWIQKFLEYFNKIDKHLDEILTKDKFIPFNEKLKEIIHGNYPISLYIKTHHDELKHLGELRNEFVHGKKVKGKPRIVPTRDALEILKQHHHAICLPPSCKIISHQEVHIPPADASIQEIEAFMLNHPTQRFFPIYASNKFIGKTSLSALYLYQKKRTDSWVRHNYSFIAENSSMFVIENILYQQRKTHGYTGVIFLTPRGDKHERIQGYITADDMPSVMKYL